MEGATANHFSWWKVNEQSWLSCVDPHDLLDLLTTSRRFGTAEYQRKLSLLCCACCRRLWPRLSQEQKKRIEIAEGIADRWGTEGFAGKPFRFRRWGQHGTTIASIFASAIEEACENRGTCLCYAASAMALQVVPPDLSWRTAEFRAARTAELAVQADLIRDLFGNPFRPQPRVAETWLCWHDGIVRQLARRIYREYDFGSFPLLADALEEAGCSNALILLHSRRPGPHARGCWLLDLLQGKTGTEAVRVSTESP